ncbi:conserved hypothetical protein [Gammaproteobacteria bacterium]
MNDEIDIEAENKKQEQKAKRIRERVLSDLRAVLKNAEGRRVLWKLLSDSGVYRISFTGEAAGTNFNEGQRSIGLQLLRDIEDAKPESLTQMRREYTTDPLLNSSKQEE